MERLPQCPIRRIAFALCGISLASVLFVACASTVEVDPPGPLCRCDASDEDGSHDGAAADASNEDGSVDEGSTDAGADAAMNDSGEPDACSPCFEREVIGVSFEPVRTRTADGQTLAQMALMGIDFLPGDRGALLWEKGGRMSHYRLEHGDLVLLGEVIIPDLYTNSDCGVQMVVADPDWEDNHYIYMSQCISLTHSVIVRYEFDGEHYDDVVDTASLIIEIGDPAAEKPWHNVGSFGFFDDDERSMWVLTGERTNAANAQDHSTNLGAVLRIIPKRGEGSAGYDPHPDNPFAGPSGGGQMSGPDLYAWGLRNPWRGQIDDAGRILIGDVGSQNEEINLATHAGQNFGWGAGADGPCTSDCDGLSDPLLSWGRSSNHRYRVEDPDALPVTTRCGFVGSTYEPRARDRYQGFLDDAALFSDLCVGYVRALSLDGDGALIRDQHVGHLPGLTSTAQGSDGYLYATSWGSCETGTFGIGGGLFRVVPRFVDDTSVPDASVSGDPLVEDPLGPFPLLISQLGIFDDDALTQPIDRVVRYEPTLPLWTNGSDKERWLLLPEGTMVDNSVRDAWEFPVGTLFFKTFSYVNNDGDEQRVETRVIRRTEAGYDYHAYAWRGSDADLLALQQVTLADVYLPPANTRLRHGIPSGFDCRSCHESNKTVIIGFDELRLNGPRSGESASQLTELAAQGIFAQDPPVDPDAVSVADVATAEVVGYLHGNCAHCHNGSATTMSPLSLEHPVAVANLVNMETEGVGQASGIRVVPGSPEMSILFQAFSGESDDPNIQVMPPIGVQKIDADAEEMLRSWITALP